MRKKTALIVCLMLTLTSLVYMLEKVEFEYNNSRFLINGQYQDQWNHQLILMGPAGEINISKGITGINHSATVTVLKGSFLITYKNHHNKLPSLYCYNSMTNQTSLLFSDPNYHFLSRPKWVVRDSQPAGFLFLGNKSDNDDLFYFSFGLNRVVNLTHTPVSEKTFEIIEHHPLRVRVLTLKDEQVITLNPDTGQIIGSVSTPRDSRPSISQEVKSRSDDETPSWYRTFMTFGDSITAGRMKMDWLGDDLFPELAYTHKTQNLLRQEFGEDIRGVAMAYPGETSFQVYEKIYTDLETTPGKYFFLYIGMNDARQGDFSADSSIETIEAIVDAALNDGRKVILTTINPITERVVAPYQDDNIRALNPRIIGLAQQKGIPWIDIYQTFLDYDPPTGWRDLLEDRDNNSIHPSPLGHDVIAGLLRDAILDIKPNSPSILSGQSLSDYRKKITWSECLDFDYAGTVLEFGYSPSNLSRSILSSNFQHVFTFVPFQGFLHTIYFRMWNVDSSGNESAKTGIDSASAN